MEKDRCQPPSTVSPSSHGNQFTSSFPPCRRARGVSAVGLQKAESLRPGRLGSGHRRELDRMTRYISGAWAVGRPPPPSQRESPGFSRLVWHFLLLSDWLTFPFCVSHHSHACISLFLYAIFDTYVLQVHSEQSSRCMEHSTTAKISTSLNLYFMGKKQGVNIIGWQCICQHRR